MSVSVKDWRGPTKAERLTLAKRAAELAEAAAKERPGVPYQIYFNVDSRDLTLEFAAPCDCASCTRPEEA